MCRRVELGLPTIAAIPAILLANVAFSPLGSGAATRAGTVVVLGTFAFIGFRLAEHAGQARGAQTA